MLFFMVEKGEKEEVQSLVTVILVMLFITNSFICYCFAAIFVFFFVVMSLDIHL